MAVRFVPTSFPLCYHARHRDAALWLSSRLISLICFNSESTRIANIGNPTSIILVPIFIAREVHFAVLVCRGELVRFDGAIVRLWAGRSGEAGA